MRKPAAVGLVVVALLAATTVPAVALQGGPPEHAGGDGPPDHAEGDGPPEHAGGSGDGPPAEDGPPDDPGDEGGETTDAGAEGGDATDDEDERAGGEDGEDTDSADGSDGDGGGDDSTVTDEPTVTEDSRTSPTETVTSLLPFDDEDDSTPEESEEAEARTAEHDDPPNPTIVDDDDDSTPTPAGEDDSTPTPAGEDDSTPTPAGEDDSTPTPSGEDGTATPSGDDDDSGSSDDADDNPWSMIGTNDSDDSGPADGASVEVRTNGSATVVEVTGAAGDTVEADLRGPATDGQGVAVESLAIEVGEDGSFTTAVTRPTGESDVDSAPGVPVAYFDVGSDTAVERATLTLDVDEDALPESVAPADLEVLRYQDGEWESVETTDDGETGVRTVETSGSGRFAVAAPADGLIEVVNVEVVDDGSGSGGERTVRATVENTGDRVSTRTVAATLDGETVATREVTLAPGEAATLAFDLPAESGTVAVGGVEAEQQRAQGTDSGAVPAPASTNGNLAFGVAAAVLVVLSAVGTGFLAARHEDWDWEL